LHQQSGVFSFDVVLSLWLEIGAQRRRYKIQIKALPNHPVAG
jgi:hypothetical protein